MDLNCVPIFLKMFDMTPKDMVNVHVCTGIELIPVMLVSYSIASANLRKTSPMPVSMYFFNSGISWLTRCMYLPSERANCISFFQSSNVNDFIFYFFLNVNWKEPQLRYK